MLITYSLDLDINGVSLNKPRNTAEAFSKLFLSVYSSFCSGNFSSINQCTEMLSSSPVSNSNVQNAI
jgi:phosphatidylglycerophosphatase A